MYTTTRHSTNFPTPEAQKQCFCDQENACKEVLYFYHSDHIGSSTFLSDAEGHAYEFMLYLPFGEAMAQQRVAGWATPYTFSGKEIDLVTGHHYFGARYYDSRLSVWMGVDPLAEKYPAWSLYNYVLNNPIILTDPTGMYPIYGSNGEYLGDDGRSGGGDLAFTGSVTNRDKNGKATEFGSLSQFTDNHAGFLNASGKIKSESSGDKTESLWIARTANNASQNEDMKVGEGVIEQINGKGYSTTKGSIGLEDNSSKANNARAGLIDVLSGGADPTGGATHWDGIDFLQKGLSHNKFKEFSPVKMDEGHFDLYQAGQEKAYRTSTNSNFNKLCTTECTNGNWGWKGGTFYNVGSQKPYQLRSVGAQGATFFWKAVKI